MPLDQLETIEAPAPALGVPTENLAASVLRNAWSHIAGRNLIALGRLVVASTIARLYGKEIFGQYSLIIVMLAIAECLLDFGTSDTFVREICRAPGRATHLLRVLTAVKAVQITIGGTGFLLMVYLLRYPQAVVHASFFAVGSLIFFGGVLLYHTLFKATLTVDREVMAELASVLVMIVLVPLARRFELSVVSIFACHMVSRACFLGLCRHYGKGRFRVSLEGVRWSDVRAGFHASAAIGIIGLVVVVYESLDVLMLSRLGSLTDVAYYSAALRFITPVVIALAGIGGTLYPVAASYWPDSKQEFANSCQRATDVVFVLAGLAICAILSGTEFLIGILSPQLTPGAAILKVLGFVLFVKALTNTLGPVLYVVKAQNHALAMAVTALALKASLILLLTPHFGFMGVAFAALGTDCATAVFTLFLLRRASSFRLQWSIPLRVVLITIVAAFVPRYLLNGHSPLSPLLAVLLFVPLVFLTRAVRWSEFAQLLRGRIS